VSIVRAGRTVDSGTLSELRHLTRTTVEAELAGPPQGLADLAGVREVRIDGNRVRCEVEAGAMDDVLRRLTAVGVTSLTSRPPTLEELFLRHYASDAPQERVAS
jgi:ABC-2 type transport system ATP-binding protein